MQHCISDVILSNRDRTIDISTVSLAIGKLLPHKFYCTRHRCQSDSSLQPEQAPLHTPFPPSLEFKVAHDIVQISDCPGAKKLIFETA